MYPVCQLVLQINQQRAQIKLCLYGAAASTEENTLISIFPHFHFNVNFVSLPLKKVVIGRLTPSIYDKHLLGWKAALIFCMILFL